MRFISPQMSPNTPNIKHKESLGAEFFPEDRQAYDTKKLRVACRNFANALKNLSEIKCLTK
jgi:hypothetical protein